ETLALREECRNQGSRQFQSETVCPREARNGRDRLHDGKHQKPTGSENGRYDHRYPASLTGFAGIPRDSSDGVQWDLSDQHRRLRASQGKPRKIAVERFSLRLSGGKFGRPRLRFPLWLPGIAPP